MNWSARNCNHMPVALESGYKSQTAEAAGPDAFQLLARQSKIVLLLFRFKLSNCIIRSMKKFSIRSDSKNSTWARKISTFPDRGHGETVGERFLLERLQKCLVALENGTSMFELGHCYQSNDHQQLLRRHGPPTLGYNSLKRAASFQSLRRSYATSLQQHVCLTACIGLDLLRG